MVLGILHAQNYVVMLYTSREFDSEVEQAVLHCQLPSGAHRSTQKRSHASRATRVAPASAEAVATDQAQPKQMETTDGEVHHFDTGAEEPVEKLDLGDIEEDDVPVDASEDMDSDALMAKLWSKWPPSCAGFGFRGESRTPTTRPPSTGDASGSRPSSYPSSRPSSRPASRLGSAQSATRPSQMQPQSSTRSRSSPQSPVARPSSASVAGRTQAGFGKPRLASSPQLARPASSPQFMSHRDERPTRPENQQSKSPEVSSPPRRRSQSASSQRALFPAGPRAAGLREAAQRFSSTPKAASRPTSPVFHPHTWK